MFTSSTFRGIFQASRVNRCVDRLKKMFENIEAIFVTDGTLIASKVWFKDE